MAIRKQEFYEGAALHVLLSNGHVSSVKRMAPFFLFNNTLLVHIKYSGRKRPPWAFTFVVNEQEILTRMSTMHRLIIGLVCGSDGIVALSSEEYYSIASPRGKAIHISCYRAHQKHYELYGPDGRLDRKIAPSEWKRILR